MNYAHLRVLSKNFFKLFEYVKSPLTLIAATQQEGW